MDNIKIIKNNSKIGLISKLTIAINFSFIFNYTITDTLVQLLEEYISEDFVKALDKLFVVSKSEELKQSMYVAYQLRESIAAKQESAATETIDELSNILASEQVQLAQQLQSALSVLQVLVLDHAPQLAPAIDDQVLQRVVEVTTQLHEDLAAVIAATHVAVQQADFANCQTEHQILKESITVDKSTIMLGQEEIPMETITLDNEFVLQEYATETIVKPVASLVVKSKNAIILEAESQLNVDAQEIAAVSFEKVAAIESTDNTAFVEMKQMVDETISAECVAVSKVESMTLDSEVLVPAEKVVPTDEKIEIDEIMGAVIDDNKVKEVIVLKRKDILQESVNLEDLNNEAASNTVSENEVKGSGKSDKVVEVLAPTTGT